MIKYEDNLPTCKSKLFGYYLMVDLNVNPAKRNFPNQRFLDRKLLKQIIQEFLLEHSTNVILDRVNISKRKLLEILTLLRIEMTKDVPNVFEGIVEVDETHVGGKWKNKSTKMKRKLGKTKRGRGTFKQAVFGIMKRNGRVYTEIIPDCKKKTLQAVIKGRIDPEAVIYSDGWRGYDGLVDVRYDKHFRVNHGGNEFSREKGIHIKWN